MVTLESILKEYFLRREDGGVFFNLNNPVDSEEFRRFLEENKYVQYFKKDKIQNVFMDTIVTENTNEVLSELRIHFDVKSDSVLSIKDKFISSLKKLQILHLNVLRNIHIPDIQEKIHRQDTNKTNRKIKIEILPSTLRLMDDNETGDSLWYIDSMTNVAFYIKFNVNVNGLLKRTVNAGKSVTAATESLHECFFAIALAYAIEENLNTYNNCVTLKDLIDILYGKINIEIKNRELIKHDFLTYISEDTSAKLSNLPSVYKLFVDASRCAEKTYEKMKHLYNKGDKYKYVARVFATGKKTKADVIVEVRNDIVNISLKYGAGQFGNLSVTKLLQGLFGYQSENSFLNTLYLFDKESVNSTFRMYIKYVNTFINKQINSNELNKEQKKQYNLEKQKYYIDEKGADYIRDFSDKSEKIRRDWYAGQFEIALKYSNNDQELDKLKSAYNIIRKTKFNDAIDNLISSNSNEKLKNIIDTIGYMLGSEDSTSYIYVAKGGNEIHLIPSKSSLEMHRYDIKVKVLDRNDTANYERKVQILLKNQLAMEMNISIRFKYGQWATDLGNSINNFRVFDVNWDK